MSTPKGATQRLFSRWPYSLPDEVLNHRAAVKAGILKPSWMQMTPEGRLAAKEAALKSLRPKKLRWQASKKNTGELVARTPNCELRIYRNYARHLGYFVYARLQSARGLEVVGTARRLSDAKQLAEDYRR